MKSSKFQHISITLSLILAFGILVWGIPSLLPERIPLNQLAENKTTEPQPTTPEFIPFSEEAIQIKASGEEPEAIPTDIQAMLDVKDEFTRRFGIAYDEAWKNQEKISHEFTIPEGIEGMVQYWTQVFGRYKKHHIIFGHKDDVSIVYSVIDLNSLSPKNSGLLPEEASKLRAQYISEEKLRIRKMLKKLASVKSTKKLSEDEKRIYAMFEKSPRALLKDASKSENIRVQAGFAHRFKKAIEISGLYMKEMENIFAAKGVPVEITRLPIVESAFNITAFSSAKAAGLWQFIPDTGKRYLKIDEYADERFDPILATYAAAQHLLNEYELLGSWPLTINAYNTGPGRMLQAIKQLKTKDIAQIIREFKAPGYKFYSRNYFPEFLAALHVYENQEYYFGKIKKMAPLKYDLFLPQKEIYLTKLFDTVDVDRQVMQKLNPGLRAPILAGQKPLPPGYMVRVPQQLGQLFAMAAVSQYVDRDRAQWHMVQPGQEIKDVARYYGVDVEGLEKLNKGNLNSLTPGTLIRLPQERGVAFGKGKSDSLE